MRAPYLFLTLALGLTACAPTPVERHWGEAKRNASDAMIAAGKHQPGPGLDGREADAGYGRHMKALETGRNGLTPHDMFAIGGDDGDE
jgi:hypothetical protein